MNTHEYEHSIYYRAKKAESARAKDARVKAARAKIAKFGMVELRRTGAFLHDLSEDAREEALYCRRGRRGGGISPLGNPFLLAAFGMASTSIGLLIAADIGESMVRDLKAITDSDVHEELKAGLRKTLRIVRRPWYYARETARRRRLAAERRKLHRRTTANDCPSPEAILAAWERRKESEEAMIRLGGMLQDLECYVDNCLRLDENGCVLGRNGGIRGWLKEHLPELSPKYKTLMRYKAMAIKLRQAASVSDPTPTDLLLEAPVSVTVTAILEECDGTFAGLIAAIERRLDPDNVFRDDDDTVRRR